MKTKFRKLSDKAVYYGQIIGVGAITGLFVGIVVTLFNVLFEGGERFSVSYYAFFRENPAFIPLLFAALFLGGIIIGGILKFLPVLRGTGFSQVEGATQGLYRFKWYEALTGMFASSLFLVFMGLSGGSEGPSLFIGGACGDMTDGVLFRKSDRRYAITGGASAGLAVALNAPLTGIIFAYEEAHKKFTPEVFVCSFSSVAIAVVMRTLLCMWMGIETGPFLAGFNFPQNVELLFCAFVLLAAFAVSLAAVCFYHIFIRMYRLFAKIAFWKGVGRYIIPLLLAGGLGLFTAYAMGSGRELIFGLVSDEVTLFGLPLWAVLLILFAVRFLATAVNTGMRLPACASVPFFAMGAILGKLLSLLFVKMGMDPALTDLLVALSMVTFFMTVVRAPITGILMTVELTGQFAFLLPAVICAAVSYFVGAAFHTKPIYEFMLEKMLEETPPVQSDPSAQSDPPAHPERSEGSPQTGGALLN